MKQSNIIRELNTTSLEAVVAKYKLSVKHSGHKFALCYDQLETPKNPTTDECRGCIITKYTM